MTEQNRTTFEWTTQRHQAAELVADDYLSDEKIAEKVGVSRGTLHEWKNTPEIIDRVIEIRRKMATRLERYAIANKARRVRALEERWKEQAERLRRLRLIVSEREEEYATNPELVKVPGGRSGYMTRQEKSLGSGPSATIVEEFTVDVGLEKVIQSLEAEMRNTEKQAAIEAGQWEEKGTLDITSGGEKLVPKSWRIISGGDASANGHAADHAGST